MIIMPVLFKIPFVTSPRYVANYYKVYGWPRDFHYYRYAGNILRRKSIEGNISLDVTSYAFVTLPVLRLLVRLSPKRIDGAFRRTLLGFLQPQRLRISTTRSPSFLLLLLLRGSEGARWRTGAIYALGSFSLVSTHTRNPY